MCGLDNHLGCLAQGSCDAAQGNDTEGFGFISGETSHPLVEDGGDLYIIDILCLQIFFRQNSQSLQRGYVLSNVAALAITECDVLHTLLGSEYCFNNCYTV